MDRTAHFEALINEQLQRVERMKADPGPTDFLNKDVITIGLIAGDGIGPVITAAAKRVLEALLRQEISSGKIILKDISGLTIENRVKHMKSVPDDVMAEIRSCDLLLKGPTTTPDKKMGYPNLESANVTLRRELDLYANIRPVRVPEEGIDWIFFRENTEGEYALGSKGIDISDDISVDFKVTTTQGTLRIARAAFEYAKNNGNLPVSIITKANILKKTDGKFLSLCYKMAEEYPQISVDDYYVDIMSANLLKKGVREKYRVFVLPNLYGDIITDEAAQIQGGVGTAGSANSGDRYAMFEAIHGSGLRMMEEGRGGYANPASLMKAAEMMLRHIGMTDRADRLAAAVDRAVAGTNMSGREGGDTADDFTRLVMEAL